MKRKLSALAILFVSAACMGSAVDPLKNPALTPVTVKSAPVHSPLKLVENGELRFALFVERKQPRNSRQTLEPAVRLIQEAFRNTTGKTPEVFSAEDAAAKKRYPVKFLLGASGMTRELGLDPLRMPREGFEVMTAPGILAIAGFDSSLLPVGKDIPNWNKWAPLKGTLWGAYDFVERFLGCRFYFPGEYGSVWPKITDLEIPPVHYADHPRFLTRDQCWLVWSFAWVKKGFWDKLLGKQDSHDSWKTPFYERWRLAETTFRMNHNPHPVPYAKENPGKEDIIFYRAPNGTFHYDSRNNMACYFDILNYRFADLLIESAKRYYENGGKGKAAFTPNDTFLCFGQADNEVPLSDMLPNPVVQKEKLITKANIESGSPYSDIYARFYKYLGERIKKEFPGKWLYVMPYASYTKAPLRDWKLPDNLQVRVCVNQYPAWIPNETVNRDVRKLISDWSRALGGRPVISLWLYNVPGNPFARAVAPEYIGRIPKILGDTLGRQDLFFDQYGNLEWYYYYSNYAAHRSMWNPDFNVDAAIDEHWEIFYGRKAAPYLKEFHKILKDMHENFFAKQKARNPIYPKASLDRLAKALEKAGENIPPGTVERKRFDLLAAPWGEAIAAQERRCNYSRPVLFVERIFDGESIVLDGKAEEPVWQRARKIGFLDAGGKVVESKHDSSFRLAWNDSGLYGFYRTKGKTSSSPSKNIWKNSNMEIFLIPGMRKDRYFHYAFDAAGQGYTASRIMLPVAMPYNPAWKSPGAKWKAVPVPGGNGWSVEFFIPYADLNAGTPEVYSSWFANLVSNTEEFLSSSMTVGNNHNYKMYGLLKFMGR